MSSADDSVRRQARQLLTAIRHARTLPQLEAVLPHLLSLISTSGTAPKDAAGSSQTVTWNGSTILCVYSMLVGAFTRKAGQLSASSVLTGGFGLATERVSGGGGGAGTLLTLGRGSGTAGSTRRLLDCMDQLQTALVKCSETHLVDVAGSALNRATSSTAATDTGGGDALRGSLLDDGSFFYTMPALPAETMNVLAYALGEMADFALQQRLQARQRLQSLLSRPFWDVQAIVDAVLEVSEVTCDSPDVLRLQQQQQQQRVTCSADDAPETTRAVTPLRDPVSQAPITLPARGLHCTHLAVFDVASFVRAVQQRNATLLSGHKTGLECPICDRYVALSDVRVDCRALKAMRAYAVTTAVATGDEDAMPHAAASMRQQLTGDHVLQWNLTTQTVTVALRDKGVAEQHDTLSLVEDEPGHDDGRVEEQAHVTEPIKRRRVEIAGHVLYVDDI